jgi:uroporphyrinogen decarboxylase
LEQVLPVVTPEFALLNEPIASFHAPVISPTHYRRFALPHLRRLVERLRMAGTGAIVVQVYGQVEALIPLWLEAGVNTLWCYHAWAARMDYLGLRRHYGKELRLIGGIPAVAVLQGQATIEEALRSTVAPLLEQGGFLPMLDDRVRANVPYRNYRYYRTRLERLVAGR